MGQVIRIDLERDDAYEVYYEPSMTDELRTVLTALQERGWSVTTDTIDSDAEIAVLRELALEEWRLAASLKGASSAWLEAMVAAALCEQQIAAVQAAAAGCGNLLRD